MTSSPATLLIVDDEEDIRSLIVDFLRDSQEYTVFEASDAEAALKFLETRKVDLVMSDINMPGMKGFDLLREIRTKYPAIKRVLITAYNVEDYLDLAIKHDIGNIFVKTTPFNFDELSTILHNLITNDIFGMDRYFNDTAERRQFRITSSKRLDIHAADLVSFHRRCAIRKKTGTGNRRIIDQRNILRRA
jgi:two-component system response regulator (stage 0 sporulation protein F)